MKKTEPHSIRLSFTELGVFTATLVAVTAGAVFTILTFVTDNDRQLHEQIDEIGQALATIQSQLVKPASDLPVPVSGENGVLSQSSSTDRLYEVSNVRWCVSRDGVQVQGEVLRAGSREPVPGVTVQLKIFAAGSVVEAAGPAFAITDAAGVFLQTFAMEAVAPAYVVNMVYEGDLRAGDAPIITDARVGPPGRCP